jgi:hypothetical protein
MTLIKHKDKISYKKEVIVKVCNACQRAFDLYKKNPRLDATEGDLMTARVSLIKHFELVHETLRLFLKRKIFS